MNNSRLQLKSILYDNLILFSITHNVILWQILINFHDSLKIAICTILYKVTLPYEVTIMLSLWQSTLSFIDFKLTVPSSNILLYIIVNKSSYYLILSLFTSPSLSYKVFNVVLYDMSFIVCMTVPHHFDIPRSNSSEVKIYVRVSEVILYFFGILKT